MCVDIMTFPDTVEEFMEQYKMVDREQIYSNGIEYVPIFRMKQWFKHRPQIDIVTCGECEYADKYNHCTYSVWWNGNADFCSHGIRR